MPNPFRYWLAIAAAAVVSALVVLVCGGQGPPTRVVRLRIACVIAMAAGVASGGFILRLPISWPLNGLGRLLCVALPAVVGIEIIACFPVVPRWFVWCSRLAFAMSAGRILLHNSVYLSGARPDWSAWQAAAVLLSSSGLLTLVWVLLVSLSHRSGGASLALSLAQSALCGGLAVMLAGYVGGGAAALPLTGAIVGCGLACGVRKLPSDTIEGAISVATVALFGLLFVGHFFGQLSTGRALALLLAPLLCWVTELPILRHRAAWHVALLRLVLVAIPLIVVLVLAKRDFDREMLPLLSG
jgi:hypothetical protein